MARGPEVANDLYRPHRMSMWGIASDVGTGTAATGAVTINDYFGLVTTEALTTGEGASYTLTLTNDKIAVGDLVFVTVGNGTNPDGTPLVTSVTPAAGSCVILIKNDHAADDFDGTLKIGFMVVKAL